MILHGAIRLWWQVKTAREIFLTMSLIWHSINKSKCKVELDFDNFVGRNCCFDVMCLIIFHHFRLVENYVSFVWMRPIGMHLLLALLNKPTLLKSACINHNLFACCFSRFFKRCDVIVTHYFIKVKCFSFYTLSKLASYSDSICCMLWFCSGWVKSWIHKTWRWRTRRTWYCVKFWWWKVRIGNAICI